MAFFNITYNILLHNVALINWVKRLAKFETPENKSCLQKGQLNFLLTSWKVSVFGVILVRFFRIRTKYGEIPRIFLYLVRMRENADQNNSEYGHFIRSG